MTSCHLCGAQALGHMHGLDLPTCQAHAATVEFVEGPYPHLWDGEPSATVRVTYWTEDGERESELWEELPAVVDSHGFVVEVGLPERESRGLGLPAWLPVER